MSNPPPVEGSGEPEQHPPSGRKPEREQQPPLERMPGGEQQPPLTYDEPAHGNWSEYGPPAHGQSGPPAQGQYGEYGPPVQGQYAPPAHGQPGPPSTQGQHGPYGVYGQQQPPQQKTNLLAILSLVFAFVFAPAGIVLGHLARRQIRTSGEQGGQIATWGLGLSYLFTALYLLGCCLAGVLIWANSDGGGSYG